MQKGQALLIVLLSMAVVLTIALSVISFSVTDIAITSRESEALRAFSAAEAGIEKSLTTFTTESGSVGQGTLDSYNTTVNKIAEGEQVYNYPLGVNAGEFAGVWFTDHDDEDNITCTDPGKCFRGSKMIVCWGRQDEPADSETTTAIEVAVYYLDPPGGGFSNLKVARDTADPNDGRRGLNSFGPAEAGCTIDNKRYAFKRTIDFAALGIPIASYNAPGGLVSAHTRVLYNSDSENVGFDVGSLPGAGNTSLPSQGRKVNSTGMAGESTRAVEVYKLYADIADVFSSAVFSPPNIVK